MRLRRVFTFLLASLTAICTALPAPPTSPQDLRALDGEWVYVEDRTEGRALEQLGPPMSSKFSMRAEASAVILVSGHGSGNRDVRVALDGSVTDVPGATEGTFARYNGAWKDGAFTYQTEFVRAPGKAPEGLIRKVLRHTSDGLLVSVSTGSTTSPSVGLYRHPLDIAGPGRHDRLPQRRQPSTLRIQARGQRRA